MQAETGIIIMEYNNIKVITRRDDEFPEFLKTMENPPDALYCIGNTRLLTQKKAAVVGAKKCSEYGRQIAVKTGETLAANHIVTVSGLAEGIDGFAHMGALRAGGDTIAVMGCGPDICYPKTNRKIYEEICRKGLIISEYPPGTEPRKWQFPARNRIIAALSNVITVVEAGIKSGAVITATYGAEQGKEVLAVPGNINSSFSAGCNKLISTGAGIITEIDDILWAMGVMPKSQKQENTPMGRDESKVYKVIEENDGITMEHLCKILKKDAFTLNGLITVMEMKGIISYQMGKIFIAKF